MWKFFAFYDSVESYFRSEGDDIIQKDAPSGNINEQNTLEAPNDIRSFSINNSNIDARAKLKSNACSLPQNDLLQSIQFSKLIQINQHPFSTENFPQILSFNSNPNQLEYTTLAIHKVLHDIFYLDRILKIIATFFLGWVKTATWVWGNELYSRENVRIYWLEG